ncbi:preprotein translocase subunit SecA [Geothrix paludis]|uniref:preprotein translocase subunit SecA n=1 Tax=Geothrix paludis TaxID=2922722 RepID=UPI001FAE4E43|nr:preprotein translocase subunit SecA [Geothrix paludis]
MIDNLLKKLIGSKNDRELKRLWAKVQTINALEPEISALSDEALKAKTPYLKEKLANGATLEDILPEAFAVAREASKRVLKMRHFDVQLVGGMVLHEGKVAEMRTGEGKTLTATLPLYLNALAGKGAHLVTVNDYLARRDAEWMGRLYSWLGLTIGVIQHGLDDQERRDAYGCDITYATNNELGFDYLRDNMKWDLEEFTQRGFHYAIVDEVDSILIDEARTPLIIAGSSEEDTSKYFRIDAIVPKLKLEVDYKVDEKDRQVMLTDDGIHRAEQLLGVANLYDPGSIETLHGLNQALLAHNLYKLDVDYMVRPKEDGKGMEVVIVDEFTGRLMPGRRWSNGLHQAIEAKEGVEVNAENQTLATVTFQNFFRMYGKLAGMTGTAETEATELHSIYKLDVIIVPTNMPMVRKDFADTVYSTRKGKKKAIVEEIRELHTKGQPVLVGTASIESSEDLADALKTARIPHVVLNAKHHEREAEIVAQAGRKGAVTIATNMAGRGTDIILGGNPEGMARLEAKKQGIALYDEEGLETAEFSALVEQMRQQTAAEHEEVVSLGGLHILGTERHESRRIDNQLRGRAGRQGDPGSSRFYLSLEDDLMRIFGGDRIKNLMGAMGMNDDEPIEAGMVTRAIERSQKRVEAHHFEIRKHLLEYDDVMNKQRIFFYGLRTEILKGNTKDYVLRVAGEIAEGLANDFLQDKGERDLAGFRERVEQLFTLSGEEVDAVGHMPQAQASEALIALVQKYYEGKDERLGGEGMRSYERWSILQIIDAAWKRHLLVMDHLKEAIGFRGYGQKDPLVEYKRESYEYFEQMRFGYEDEIISYLYRVEPQPAYTPDEDLFRGPGETIELGPDEQGNAPDGIQRVLRFTAGGLED